MFPPGHQGWSVGIVFIPVTEISVVKSEISVIGQAGLLIRNKSKFYGEKSGVETSRKPSQSSWPGHLKRPEWGWQKPWRYIQGSLGIIYLLIFQHCLRNYMSFRGSTNRHFTRRKKWWQYIIEPDMRCRLNVQPWTYCLENFPRVPLQCWRYQRNQCTRIFTPTLNWGEGAIFFQHLRARLWVHLLGHCIN